MADHDSQPEFHLHSSGEGIPPQSSSPLLPPPSEREAITYYAGLPSGPLLAPTGPEAYRVIRELRPVPHTHALKKVWEVSLALEVHTLLDSIQVKWTSTDVMRIGNQGEPSNSFLVVLWIGVMPGSLSGEDGVVVASKCRELLVKYDITDVDVEIRESVVTRSAGPKLLPSRGFLDTIADVREPFATTLGLPISAQSTSHVEDIGTGGFFIAESRNTERLLLVTARHIVFKPDENNNEHFEYKKDREDRFNVMLFGDVAFAKYVDFIRKEIGDKEWTIQFLARRNETEEKEDGAAWSQYSSRAQAELDEAKKALEELKLLYDDVSTCWAAQKSRILGHVVLSPPIRAGVGSEEYTEDWTVIEIDASKADVSNFCGNAIDLGTRIGIGEFSRLMRGDSCDRHSFTYPLGRRLKLSGTISDDEMRHLAASAQDDDPNFRRLDHRANSVFSYVRYHDEDGSPTTSKEWAILPLESKPGGAFSERGDSGSVIVDGRGRIGGLLTGGAGSTKPSRSSDITYATPITFLLRRLEENGLRGIDIDPLLTASTHFTKLVAASGGMAMA
ncbi:hypothetical protein DFH06DRAFT_1429749 [Mycena polygramma]|nr:hypothetical protein DFH06DRAFT_1429749 [Mycena polygramma]